MLLTSHAMIVESFAYHSSLDSLVTPMLQANQQLMTSKLSQALCEIAE